MEFEVVQRVIADKMEIDIVKVTEDATLQDLEIDSLDMVDITMDLEEELGVSLEDLADVTTVGDVVAYIVAQKA